MVRDDFRGDFTGFEFGGVHSSELGIVRVSGGDRYEENLYPEIKDITAEVSGMDGQYYFGSNYGTRAFDVEFAFDSLTEDEFRRLRTTFGTREIKQLIFDERPYKYYMAKIENPIELSYVCFDEPKKHIGEARDGVRVKDRIYTRGAAGEAIVGYSRTDTEDPILTKVNREQVTPFEYDYVDGVLQRERIYKGEGKISFICYFPFAKSVFKTLPSENIYKNVNDWAFSSGILSLGDYERFDVYSNNDEIIINPSDDFSLNETTFKQVVGGYGIYLFACYDNGGVIAWKLNDEPINSLETYGASCETAVPGDVYTVAYLQPGAINIYNAGDVSTGFRLYCSFAASFSMRLSYRPYSGADEAQLNVKEIIPKVGDIGFLINTTNGLIQGVQSFNGPGSYILSGNLYNEYIDSGYFFKLSPNLLSTDGARIDITDWEGNVIESGYVETADTTVKDYKIYYIQEGDGYTVVDNPSENPHEAGYLEYKYIDIFYDYLYF